MANYRSIHTKLWVDPKIEPLSVDARYLFVYLITNEHRNESGLYSITVRTISNETSLSPKRVTSAFAELWGAGRVAYDSAESVVWVVNAARHTPMSDNCIRSIARDIEYCSSVTLREMFCRHYANHLSLQVVSKRFANPSVTVAKGFLEPPIQGTGYKVQGTGIPEKPEDEKRPYGEFGNVMLTDKERVRLTERLGGDPRANQAIEILSAYKKSKNKKYSSDYATFSTWVIGELEDRENKPKKHNPNKRPTNGALSPLMMSEMEARRESHA